VCIKVFGGGVGVRRRNGHLRRGALGGFLMILGMEVFLSRGLGVFRE